jgi:hypothetical protein
LPVAAKWRFREVLDQLYIKSGGRQKNSALGEKYNDLTVGCTSGGEKNNDQRIVVVLDTAEEKDSEGGSVIRAANLHSGTFHNNFCHSFRI